MRSRLGETHPGRFSPHAASNFNQAMMELGALVCVPREARCQCCPLANLCEARLSGRVAELPMKPPRPSPTRRRFVAFVLQHRDQFLVRQRPAGEVNAHLWEFPNVEVKLEKVDAQAAAEQLLGSIAPVTEFCSVKHSITRYRITLDVFRARPRSSRPVQIDGAKWVNGEALEALAFASAHKKIVQRLRQD